MRDADLSPRRNLAGRRTLPAWARALAFVVLGVQTGCSITNKEKRKADPILGEIHPQGAPAYGPAPPTPKEKSAASTQPASRRGFDDPLVASPTSNAYLASLTKPLPGSRPLAIADGSEPGPFRLTSSDPLVRPVPRDPAFVNGSWVSPQTTSRSGSSGGSFAPPPSDFIDPQTALLRSRGVLHHRIDPLPNGATRLTAVVGQAAAPERRDVVEVVERDFPAAVRRLIDQLDQR